MGFLIDRALLAGLTIPDLVFGCPWWDLWLPIAAVAAGVPLVTDHAVRVYHQRHDMRWLEEAYLRLGRMCLRHLAALSPAGPSLGVNFLRAIAIDAGCNLFAKMPERVKLDWFSEVMRSIIANESKVIQS